MTTSVSTTWGDIDGVWTNSDPADIALASASLADGVRDLIDGFAGNFTTVALLLASAPASTSWATANNAPGARFQYVSGTWTMYGTPRFVTSAARNAALTAPAVGWMSRIDTERFDRRATGSGTTWNPYGAAEFPIIPTAAGGTGVTLGTDGKVTFSAATAMTIDGIFTSSFDNYELVLDYTISSAGSANLQVRASGSTVSTATYDYVQLYGTAAAPGAATTNGGTSLLTGGTNVTRHYSKINLNNPFLAQPTLYLSNDSGWITASTMASFQAAGAHRNSTSYDGVAFTPSAGNMTGTLRIYGYNNN